MFNEVPQNCSSKLFFNIRLQISLTVKKNKFGGKFLSNLFSIHVHRIIDAGGQKNQRKKWIHFFEGVTAVVFFVSLSSYDEFVEEDESSVCYKLCCYIAEFFPPVACALIGYFKIT